MTLNFHTSITWTFGKSYSKCYRLGYFESFLRPFRTRENSKRQCLIISIIDWTICCQELFVVQKHQLSSVLTSGSGLQHYFADMWTIFSRILAGLWLQLFQMSEVDCTNNNSKLFGSIGYITLFFLRITIYFCKLLVVSSPFTFSLLFYWIKNFSTTFAMAKWQKECFISCGKKNECFVYDVICEKDPEMVSHNWKIKSKNRFEILNYT